MARDRSRRTEGSLLFLALLILSGGFLLVLMAKTRAGLPPDAININTASRDDLALELEIDPDLAAILIQHRDRMGGFASIRRLSTLTLFPNPADESRVRSSITGGSVDVDKAGIAELQKLLSIPRLVARRIVTYRELLPEKRFRKPLDAVRVPVLDERSIAALGNRLIVRTPAEVLWSFLLYGGSLALLLVLVPAFLRGAGIKGDPFLLPIALTLASLGVIMLFSLRDPFRDSFEFAHHVQGIWMGMAALLAGAMIPAHQSSIRWVPARSNLRRYTYLWGLGAILLTLALWRLGTGPEGVRLSLGFFQPIELVKILLVLFLAGYLTERGDLLADALHRWRPPLPKNWPAPLRGISLPRRQDIGPILGMFAAALVTFMIVRDLGPALLLFGVFLVTLYLATGRAGIAWTGLLLAVVGGWLAYRMHIGVVPVRVEMWQAPWANRYPGGMQLGQSLWAMGSGGIWGSGLGLGAPGTLPRGRDDLIFSALSEELGLVGSLVILALYAVLVARGLRAALSARTDFDRLLAGGLTALIGCQTLLIVAGVTGVLPLTGITLPFISYGNTSLVVDFFVLGLLRAISSPSDSVPVGASNPLFGRTIRGFATVFAAALLGIIGAGRLLWIQAIDADRIAGSAIRTPDADGVPRAKINPRLLAMERAIPRGSIYDRNGKVLATSRLDEISRALEDDPEHARRYYRRGRFYPLAGAFAHLIGYLDPSLGGPVGLEKEYHPELRGFGDYSELLADYRAKDMPSWLGGQRKRQGSDLWLTVDGNMQEDASRLLKQAAGSLTDERTGKHKDRAAMVILDPTTGAVLVSASVPSFDPNMLSPSKWAGLLENRDESFRLVDRARFGLYPPGSSIKLATAAAGLEEGVEPVYDCNHVAHGLHWRYHGASYGLKQLADDKGDPPHDHIGMARGLRVSCNLYFANLGIVLGAERLHRAYADRFELRAVRPLDAFAPDLAMNAFGQGTMLASPTEMARIAASVANQGRMMKPFYVREVKDPLTRETRPIMPALMGRPMGEINAKRIADMMRSVVTDGTARGVFDDTPVEVAGKTGTAQTDQGDGQPHSWFIGFTPFSRPQFAFACVIENGGYGKRGAAPAVRNLLKTLFNH